MKYVFFGTPRLARIVLGEVLPHMPPMAVVTNPDRPAGRKQILTPPPVKLLLQESAPLIELLQPEKLREVTAHLRELQPDLFVVAAYGKIIPQEILDIPRLGTVGVHPSLLPRYRGATPMQSTILGGDEETGVSLYMMDAQVDHGPVLATQRMNVDQMDYFELEAALAALGGKMLLEVLPKVFDGTASPIAQDESLATFTKKFSSDDAFVDWNDLATAIAGDSNKAQEVWRKVRAFNPEPGAWTEKDGVRIKLLQADLDGAKLSLREIQRAGGKPEAIAPNSLP